MQVISVNHSQYECKQPEEIRALLEDKDHLFAIVCGKCFRSYDRISEPEGAQFSALAESMGKTLTGVVQADFLCNPIRGARTLTDQIPEGTNYVCVIACGLGVQTVADLTELPTLAIADSIPYGGHHGMALTEKKCGGCSQCYLSATGGICPVVDCAKGLLNGQCGGAKNGKCEADLQRDCAWEKIYRRLEKQGRTEEFCAQAVQLRDYSQPETAQIKAYVREARARRFEGFYGGVHPSEHKERTCDLPLQTFPEPEIVTLPLAMHIGAPAIPTVQPGDAVTVGQCIGQPGGYVSAAVHSSVSGTVLAVEPRRHPTRGDVLSVVIRNDGKNTLHPSVRPGKPLEALRPEEIVALVREKGIVGMGGAAFPTDVKLNPGKPIDTVLLNGSECEPYLTADHRIMLEFAEDVVYGLRAMMKAVGAPEGIILIEDNKPDAIARMKHAAAQYPKIRIESAKTQYPEGAEKMLIQKALHRRLPSGMLPADVGCLVSNVSTAKAVADAILRGMPLTQRAVTVTGECIRKPGNFLVKVGTGVEWLLAECGGITRPDAILKMGGPMMGTPIADLASPILKGSNGVIATDPDPVTPRDCIRCGRCVDVCPMELAPLKLLKYAELGDTEMLRRLSIQDCFACRCCDYICSAKIPLAEKIQEAKAAALRKK